MASKSRTSDSIYQIKVTLRGTKPPVWRRLLVPAAMTLADLHHVLQSCMEWDDSHLHQFRIGDAIYAPPDPEAASMGLAIDDERTARLHRVLGIIGARAVYEYDFGDGWEHTIVVEKILPPIPGQSCPLCIGGKRRGPPEDCGGAWGYATFIEAIRDPNHEQHEDMVEWYSEDFDPEEFDVEDMNDRLAWLRDRK